MRSLKRITKWGVPSAALVTLASAALSAPQASAHDACSAVTAGSGWSCVAVNNQTSGVHSWRNPDSNNQCLPNSAIGQTVHYQSAVRLVASPTPLVPYADSACGTPYAGNLTQNAEGPTKDNYVIYDVSQKSSHSR